MATPNLVESFNTGIGPNLQTLYTEVHVLLIKWADNDLKRVDKEISKLRAIFEQSYKYTSVSEYSIPIDGSQQRSLNHEILSFVENQSSRADSLIIVFYAGHCAASAQGFAEWAAYEKKDSPTLAWNIPQQLLFSARGDVLLILDCCHASLIARGSKDNGGRFELIAACAKGRPTPVPGQSSFTSALVRSLEIHADQGITSEGLASELREDVKITETPVFHDFVRKSPTRIRLQRLQTPDPPGFMQKPSGYLLFRAALSGDVTGRQIADWLKTAPPDNVTAVRIEAVVSRARQMLKDGAFPPGSIFERLPPAARADILHRLRNLHTVMANTADNAAAPVSSQQSDGKEVIEKSFDDMQEAVSTVCTAIETPLLLDDAANPEIMGDDDNKGDTRLNAQEDPDPFYKLMASAGVQAALALHQAILDNDPCEYSTELDIGQISFETSPKTSAPNGKKSTPSTSRARFRFGTFDGQPAIIEVYKYKEAPLSDNLTEKNTPSKGGEPYPQTLQQVAKMTGLLCHPKRKAFHILPCTGFFRDRFHKEMGLVFLLPPQIPTGVISSSPQPPPPGNIRNRFTTLIELYAQYRLVPLGHRIHLAFALAAAVEHFHRVGWVHKTLRSGTIGFVHVPSSSAAINNSGPPRPLLIPPPPVSADDLQSSNSTTTSPTTVDLSNPYLFNFEYARHNDGTTYLDEDHSLPNNLYRHPHRWGKPYMRFTKSHDVYSLGIILFEIANWKDIYSLATKWDILGSAGGQPLAAADVKNTLVGRYITAKKILPHQIGHVFAGVILTCLDFDERTRGMSEYEGQVYFQKKVVEPLGRAIGRV
ncbi:hypothetical protein V8F06_006157 [Rhypophila decipiens]